MSGKLNSSKPLLDYNDRVIVGNLSVYPSSLYLKNIEIGKTYELALTAQNLSKEPKSLHAAISNTSHYIIKNLSQFQVSAPYGLDKKITIEFTPKEEREYNDTVIISTDKDQ